MPDFLFPFTPTPQGDLAIATTPVDQVRSLILSYLSVNRGDRICQPGWGQPTLAMVETNLLQFRLEDVRRDLLRICQSYGASIEVLDNTEIDGKIRVRWSLPRSGESGVEVLTIA